MKDCHVAHYTVALLGIAAYLSASLTAAFAMLGAALERILNPRLIDSMPLPQQKRDVKQTGVTQGKRIQISRRMLTGLVVMLLLAASFVPLKEGKTLTSNIIKFLDPIWRSDLRIMPTHLGHTDILNPSPLLL